MRKMIRFFWVALLFILVLTFGGEVTGGELKYRVFTAKDKEGKQPANYFRLGEKVYTRCEFSYTGQRTVKFKWINSLGRQVAETEYIFVGSHSGDAWIWSWHKPYRPMFSSILGSSSRGIWKIQVFVDDKKVSTINFMLEVE